MLYLGFGVFLWIPKEIKATKRWLVNWSTDHRDLIRRKRFEQIYFVHMRESSDRGVFTDMISFSHQISQISTLPWPGSLSRSVSEKHHSVTTTAASDRLQRAAVSWPAVVLRQTLAGLVACYLKTELEVITAGSSLKCLHTLPHICLLEAIRCRRC